MITATLTTAASITAARVANPVRRPARAGLVFGLTFLSIIGLSSTSASAQS
jgi:hypothetical protein